MATTLRNPSTQFTSMARQHKGKRWASLLGHQTGGQTSTLFTCKLRVLQRPKTWCFLPYGLMWPDLVHMRYEDYMVRLRVVQYSPPLATLRSSRDRSTERGLGRYVLVTRAESRISREYLKSPVERDLHTITGAGIIHPLSVVTLIYLLTSPGQA